MFIQGGVWKIWKNGRKYSTVRKRGQVIEEKKNYVRGRFSFETRTWPRLDVNLEKKNEKKSREGGRKSFVILNSRYLWCMWNDNLIQRSGQNVNLKEVCRVEGKNEILPQFIGKICHSTKEWEREKRRSIEERRKRPLRKIKGRGKKQLSPFPTLFWGKTTYRVFAELMWFAKTGIVSNARTRIILWRCWNLAKE